MNESTSSFADDFLMVQEESWEASNYLPVESILAANHAAVDDPSVILELVCNEIRLRSELTKAEERLRLKQEMISRFPNLRESLDRQFLAEDVISAALPRSPVRYSSATMSLEEQGELELPGYRELRRIAKGSFGVVYRGLQNGTDKDVAIKILDEIHSDDPHRIHVMKSEARRLTGVDHPNVISVLETGEFHGRPYYSMRFVSGGTLRQKMDTWHDRRADAPHAVTLMAGIAAGVMAANARGVFHGDLKPSNVLMDGDVPVVADFGLARRIRSSETASSDHSRDQSSLALHGGTPGYVAPEMYQFDNDGISSSAEVYSLGVILFEMLVGQLPCRPGAENVPQFDLLEQVHVPHDVRDICRTCLATDPAQRYSTVESFYEDLRNYLAGRFINASRLTGPRRQWHRLSLWTRRSRVTAALVFVIVAGTGATLWSTQSKNRMLAAAVEETQEQKLNLADGLYELGRLSAESGSLRQTESVYRRSLDLYSGLLSSANNKDPQIQRFRNRTRNNLSVVCRQLGHTEEARSLLESIVSELPTNQVLSAEELIIAGDAHANLANLASAEGNWILAEQCLQNARDARSRAAGLSPEDEFAELTVLRTDLDLCEVSRRLGNPAQALQQYKTAIERLEHLNSRFPKDIETFEYLLRARINRSLVCESINQIDSAREDLQSAVRGYERLLGSEAGAKIPRLRRQYAIALLNLGRVEAQVDHTENAAGSYREAISQFQTLLRSPEFNAELALEYVTAITNAASLAIEIASQGGRHEPPEPSLGEALKDAVQILDRSEKVFANRPIVNATRFKVLDLLGTFALLRSETHSAQEFFSQASLIDIDKPDASLITLDDRLQLASHECEVHHLVKDRAQLRKTALNAIRFAEEGRGRVANPAFAYNSIQYLHQVLGLLELEDAEGVGIGEDAAREHLQTADALLSKSIEIGERGIGDHALPFQAEGIARSLELRALVRMKRAEFGLALTDWEQALVTTKDKEKQGLLGLGRLKALASLGRIRECVDSLDAMIERSGDSALFEIYLIATAGFVYQIVERDPSWNSEQKAPVKEHCLQLTLSMSRSHQKRPDRQLETLMEVLKTDDDLMEMRKHPDFQSLLMELNSN